MQENKKENNNNKNLYMDIYMKSGNILKGIRIFDEDLNLDVYQIFIKYLPKQMTQLNTYSTIDKFGNKVIIIMNEVEAIKESHI
jgi:hypothetical protein